MNTLLSAVRTYGFGLWTGAMVGFAFLFAPQAFTHIGPTPAFGSTIGASITALTQFGYLCTAFIVASAILQRAWLPAVIAAVMCGLSAYEIMAILPIMQHTQLSTPAYEALHHRSSSVYSVILLLGLIGTGVAATARKKSPARAGL